MASTFQSYHILKKLGEGGMGTVYLAEGLNGQLYALKTIRPDVASSREYNDRFLRETRLAFKLRHHRIVATYDVGSSRDGTLFMVCELCPNGDLANWIKIHGQPSMGQVLQWLYDLSLGLEYADQNSVIHRDIKPQNLLLDDSLRVKLGDLGCARRTTADATRLTVEGSVQGTPFYISPEQAQGRNDLDIRGDIYSMGATFYHVITGRPLFSGTTAAQIILKHVRETPEPLINLRPDIPRSLADFIHSTLTKDRADRIQTPALCIQDIKRIADEINFTLDESVVLTYGAAQTLVSEPIPEWPLGSSGRCLPVAIPESPSGTNQSSLPKPDAGVFQQSPSEEKAVIPLGFAPTIPDGYGDRIVGDFEGTHLAVADISFSTPEFLPAQVPEWIGDKAILGVSDASGRCWLSILYTRTPVKFGRLRDENVDICARLYPADDLKRQNLDISGVHGWFDLGGSGWLVSDNDSKNGMTLDGKPVPPNGSLPLGEHSELLIAKVLLFDCRIVHDPRVKGRTSNSLAIYRASNRAEMSMVVLNALLPIGGDSRNTGLNFDQARIPRLGTLTWRDRRFWWQPSQAAAFQNVEKLDPHQAASIAESTPWCAGGLEFRLRRFTYDVYR